MIKLTAEVPGIPGTVPAAEAVWHDGSVVAERAPIGVQLWPTREPKYAPNFTLERVEIVREIHRSWVRWTYQGGQQRVFFVGESVAVRTERPLSELPPVTM